MKAFTIFCVLALGLHSVLLFAQKPEYYQTHRNQDFFFQHQPNFLYEDGFHHSKPSFNAWNSQDLMNGVQETWVSNYASESAPGYDRATDLAVDDAGNVYITGSSLNTPYEFDYFTAKYDPLGNLVWTALYNGTRNGDDRAQAINVDGDGNVYVTGGSPDSGTSTGFATIKYGPDGIQQWIVQYHDQNGWADMRDLAVDKSGNVYITGHIDNRDNLGPDYFTIKYSDAGVEQWRARYRGSGYSEDYANALALDNFGNVYVTGRAGATLGAYYDFVTVKYNRLGEEQWVRRYNGPGSDRDEAWDIVVDNLGNVYVTGESTGENSDQDFLTVKYDSSGHQVWDARYNGPANFRDTVTAIKLDPAGNVYVTGGTRSRDEFGYYADYTTIKYDSSGLRKWIMHYDGSKGWDFGSALAVDKNQNVHVTGSSEGLNTGSDCATIKYNSNGVEQWVARYNGASTFHDWAYDIAVDLTGNAYVTGWRWSGSLAEYVTIKYSTSGKEQWVKTYSGSGDGNSYPAELVLDGMGNIYVTGRSFSATTGNDFHTVKYSPDGTQQWIALFNHPENTYDAATAIAVDGWGAVYVTGRTGGNYYGNSGYITTVKYTQKEYFNRPKTFNLSQNYPNPFNASTVIRYRLENASQVELKIYNLLGQEIETLLEAKQMSGEYEVQWNPTNVSSGTYVYRLHVREITSVGRNLTDVKKLVLLK